MNEQPGQGNHPYYGPWGGHPGSPYQQQPLQPPRRRRLPVVVGALGLAAVVTVASVAWGIDQRAVANSAKLHQVMDPAAVAAQVSPALVDVDTVLGYEGARAAGTGIVLTPDGEVLTNHHVVQGATQITVTDIGNGKTYAATVAGYDSTHDIAVLRLKDASGLKTASLGDSSQVAVGEQVVGIGNAGGVGGLPSYAAGRVTGLNQAITATDDNGADPENLTGLIATDANIRAGDSGGPLVDAAGQVVGVDTAGSGGSTGPGAGSGTARGAGGPGQTNGQTNGRINGQSNGQGGQAQPPQGFAIPIDEALAVADQIEAGNASATVHIGATPMLGVAVVPAGTQGVVVGGDLAGGRAEAAGITAGDVITAIDGHPIDSPDALSTVLDQHHPGDKVSVTWFDQLGRQHTAAVQLTTGPVH